MMSEAQTHHTPHEIDADAAAASCIRQRQMVILADQGHRRLSTRFTRPIAPRGLPIAPARSARSVALGVLLSLSLSGAAFGQDDGDEDEEPAKAGSVLPNIY